jgi:integrase
MLNVFLKYFKKETVLDDFTPMRIEEFKTWLSHKKVAKDQTISKARINRYLSVLRLMFNLAIEWEIFDRSNPVRKSHFLKEPPARDMIFSSDEIHRLWIASVNLAHRSRTMNQKIFPAFLLTALMTGCRMSELIHLKVSDYQDGFFIIHKTKSNKKRTVPVRDELIQLLMRFPRSDDFIFPLTRMNSDVLRKTWYTVKENAGIKREARFHDLRHTHVSFLLQSGADIKTVQEIGGWSDLKMLERYAHTNAPLKTAAVTRIPLPDLSEYEI